ncbi:MarR family winged helix-turn-helix transcriptional regulator [Enterovirga sp. CN4-39]|uniref:MarR family winged helix-turn-helix transcriptional regulator n=1 Tax=Enterovirga sp. CN4-39 TaxID=3400910 RepID=UPI003C112DE9
MEQVNASRDHPIDAETIAAELPGHHREELRLWLRLLTCTNMIEGEIRRRLRRDFDVTLPRFDLMAQLEKTPQGMTLSDISKRMMVSNGNITGLVDRLVASGHVTRRASDTDRRAQLISLTELGRAEFRAMAEAHEGWIAEMFAGLSHNRVEQLMELLSRTKSSVREASLNA